VSGRYLSADRDLNDNSDVALDSGRRAFSRLIEPRRTTSTWGPLTAEYAAAPAQVASAEFLASPSVPSGAADVAWAETGDVLRTNKGWRLRSMNLVRAFESKALHLLGNPVNPE
jgi:hypothetical protein